MELGPLSLGAIRRILSDRLGLSVSRQLLRRIYDATLGNALFALEVGRKLVDEGPPGIGEDLPVPDAVEDLLGLRVDRLPEGVRRLLLAVALSPDLRVGQLDALADTETLDLAVASGVLVVTGDHVRASHPLLAAAVVERADAAECRELHRRLAAAVGDGELGARHRRTCRSAARREPRGRRVGRGGSGERARGTADRGRARRSRPPAHPAQRPGSRRAHPRARPLPRARGREAAADRPARARARLASPGEQRVRACLLLASGTVAGNDDIRRFLERALAESGSDAMSRAAVLAEMAANDAAVRVARIARGRGVGARGIVGAPAAAGGT